MSSHTAVVHRLRQDTEQDLQLRITALVSHTEYSRLLWQLSLPPDVTYTRRLTKVITIPAAEFYNTMRAGGPGVLGHLADHLISWAADKGLEVELIYMEVNGVFTNDMRVSPTFSRSHISDGWNAHFHCKITE